MDSIDSIKTGFFDGGRLSHAYIASGGMADTIAAAAVCAGTGAVPCGVCPHCNKSFRGVHPDVTIVVKPKERQEIIVEQIRDIKKDVIVLPNQASKKAYVVVDADLMNRNAQNAFLNVLEEAPAHVVLILKTDNPAALLPTIRSRCVVAKAQAAVSAVMEAGAAPVAEEMAKEFYTALDGGNLPLVEFMFRLEKLEKPVFTEFLSAAREQAAGRLRQTFSGGSGAPREKLASAERILFRAGEMLDLNVSVGHLSGMICAALLTVES